MCIDTDFCTKIRLAQVIFPITQVFHTSRCTNSRSAFMNPALCLSPRVSINQNLSKICFASSVLVVSWLDDSMLQTYSIVSDCDSVLFIWFCFSMPATYQKWIVLFSIIYGFLARHGQFLATPCQDRDAQRLTKRLNRHRQEPFTFLNHEGFSPWNNHTEQQMRKSVLTQKVSQQNRSARGANTQAIIMTLLRSAKLQGANPVKHLLG